MKKLFLFVTALMMGTSMFAALDNPPLEVEYHDYLITFISPDCNEEEYITPAISGDFNSWAQQAMTYDKNATDVRKGYQLPGAVFTITVHAAEGSEYRFRSSKEWGAGWTNVLMQYDYVTEEWKPYNDGSNFSFDKSLETEYDLGDPTMFRWTITDRPITINVPSTGKATIYSDNNLIVPEDVKVYGLANQGNYLNYVNTTPAANAIIPANQGYLVEANEGSYSFVKTNAAVTAPITSCLSGVTVETPVADISGTVYSLACGIKGMGFYRFNGTTLAAGKAFYVVSAPTTKEFIGLSEATGIESIHNSEFKINNDGKFLENGKIVIVKNNKKFNVVGQQNIKN